MYGTINQNQSCEPHFLDYSSFSLIFEYAKSMNNYAWHFPILKFHEYSQSSFYFVKIQYSIAKCSDKTDSYTNFNERWDLE